MQPPEKKPTPVHDFYDALIDIEHDLEDVDDAKAQLAKAIQKLGSKKKALAELYFKAAEVAAAVGKVMPDRIISGTALVQIDEEGDVSVERVDAVDRYHLINIAKANGEEK